MSYYQRNREKIIKKSTEYYHKHKNDPEYIEKRREYFNNNYYEKNKDILLLKAQLNTAKKTIEKLKEQPIIIKEQPIIIYEKPHKANKSSKSKPTLKNTTS